MLMIEGIRHKMMALFEERRHSEKDTDLIVSKVAKSIQLAKVNLAYQCQYMTSSEMLYEVLSTRTNTQYVVDFEKRTCSCRTWQGLGYPCHHAIAVTIGHHWDPSVLYSGSIQSDLQWYHRVSRDDRCHQAFGPE